MCVGLLILFLFISTTEGTWLSSSRVIHIEIEYNWKLLVTETYIETYSSLWSDIAGLIKSHPEFNIYSMVDVTPNTTRRNITYKFEDAADLWNREDTIIWNTTINVKCKSCWMRCGGGGKSSTGRGSQRGCYELDDYVNAHSTYEYERDQRDPPPRHDGLRVELINKYDGYWGVLNIIDVDCSTGVNYSHFMNHWMIIIFSVLLVSCASG